MSFKLPLQQKHLEFKEKCNKYSHSKQTTLTQGKTYLPTLQLFAVVAFILLLTLEKFLFYFLTNIFFSFFLLLLLLCSWIVDILDYYHSAVFFIFFSIQQQQKKLSIFLFNLNKLVIQRETRSSLLVFLFNVP